MTTDFTRDWIAKREQLEKAATEGPWCAEYGDKQGDCVIPHDAETTHEAVAITRLYRSGADAEFIAAARTALPAAVAALKAVLEMHRPVDVEPSDTICGECSFQLPNGRFFGKVVEWPCPTVTTIEDELRSES